MNLKLSMLNKKNRQTGVQTVLFHSHKIKENEIHSIVTEYSDKMVVWRQVSGWGEKREGFQWGMRKLWRVRNMSIILNMVMVSWVATYARICTLSRCSLLNINYISPQLFKKSVDNFWNANFEKLSGKIIK